MLAQVAQAIRSRGSSSDVREGFESLVNDTNDALAVETTNVLVTNLNYSFSE